MLKKNGEKVHFNVGTQVSHRSQRVKKQRSDIYRKSNYATFYVTSPSFLHFRTFQSGNRLYIVISVEKNHSK